MGEKRRKPNNQKDLALFVAQSIGAIAENGDGGEAADKERAVFRFFGCVIVKKNDACQIRLDFLLIAVARKFNFPANQDS